MACPPPSPEEFTLVLVRWVTPSLRLLSELELRLLLLLKLLALPLPLLLLMLTGVLLPLSVETTRTLSPCSVEHIVASRLLEILTLPRVIRTLLLAIEASPELPFTSPVMQDLSLAFASLAPPGIDLFPTAYRIYHPSIYTDAHI